MQFFKYTVLLEPDEDDKETYNVIIPALPEIATFGSSIEEARFMAQDALELVILSRLEEGEKIPQDKLPKKISPGTKIEELVISVSHQVEATPSHYVKDALFKSQRSA